ncbi:hypothetical protein KJ969_00975 [Patescibacteria group bacterium]|nr:hypothetical protein [Patescibacteria group bacterium]
MDEFIHEFKREGLQNQASTSNEGKQLAEKALPACLLRGFYSREGG